MYDHCEVRRMDKISIITPHTGKGYIVANHADGSFHPVPTVDALSNHIQSWAENTGAALEQESERLSAQSRIGGVNSRRAETVKTRFTSVLRDFSKFATFSVNAETSRFSSCICSCVVEVVASFLAGDFVWPLTTIANPSTATAIMGFTTLPPCRTRDNG